MNDRSSPWDPADDVLSRYFRSERPSLWPELPAVEPARPAAAASSRVRGYLALAACGALLLAGLAAVGLIKDTPRPRGLPDGAGPPTARLPAELRPSANR